MPDEFKKLVTEKTKLAVVCHSSNVTGALQPVETLGQIVREKGGYLLLDAAQTAGIVPIDMRNMPVDMLAAAGHKKPVWTAGNRNISAGRKNILNFVLLERAAQGLIPVLNISL